MRLSDEVNRVKASVSFGFRRFDAQTAGLYNRKEGRCGFGPESGRTAGTERRKDTFPAEICTEEAERCSI